MKTEHVKYLAAVILLILLWGGSARTEPLIFLPEIKVPTPPSRVETDINAFLQSRTHRFDVQGTLTQFYDGKIWVNGQPFPPSEKIQYRRGRDRIFLSDLKVGQRVGLVLWPDGSILQLWEIHPH